MTIHIAETDRPFVVCPECRGEGHIGPGHVFTQEDRDEYDPDDFADMMADYRAGVYDVRCPTCDGRRVVKDECPCDECEDERQEIAELEAMERAERAFGC
jgi:hypothetical protein